MIRYAELALHEKEKMVMSLLALGKTTTDIGSSDTGMRVISAAVDAMFSDSGDRLEITGDLLLKTLTGESYVIIYTSRIHKKIEQIPLINHLLYAALTNYLNLSTARIGNVVEDLQNGIPVLVCSSDFLVQDFPRIKTEFCYALKGVVSTV